MDSDSIRCFLPGPNIWMLQRCSLPISKLFLWVDGLHITDNGWWRMSSADNLTVDNQTNLAIKGIIAIQAMSKMASVVNRTDDVNKYSVCTGSLYVMSSDINSPIECCCEALCSMEEPCIEQWPASPCSVWANEFVDFGLQSICGCVARHRLGGIVGWCSRILVSCRLWPVSGIHRS
jgi:hypothetical protein